MYYLIFFVDIFIIEICLNVIVVFLFINDIDYYIYFDCLLNYFKFV